MVNRIGQFGADNRAGIERTLHRISAIRNRSGDVVGLTCRVGRAVFGTVAIVRDLLDSGESLLLMGRPGVGKTTALREIARVLAEDLHKRVVVIDTSNEIAGDGDIPHPAIGRARRMQVARPELQHQVMIEAVENHMPEVIVIDEIGTELEAQAARTIAERGVMLVATAHGNALANLIKNPTLCDLVGGSSPSPSVTTRRDVAERRKRFWSVPPNRRFLSLWRCTVAIAGPFTMTSGARWICCCVDKAPGLRSASCWQTEGSGLSIPNRRCHSLLSVGLLWPWFPCPTPAVPVRVAMAPTSLQLLKPRAR